MECKKSITIPLTTEETNEIESIIERINGLEELLMIIPNAEKALKNKVNQEIYRLNEKRKQFCLQVMENNNIRFPSPIFEIDIDKSIVQIK